MCSGVAQGRHPPLRCGLLRVGQLGAHPLGGGDGESELSLLAEARRRHVAQPRRRESPEVLRRGQSHRRLGSERGAKGIGLAHSGRLLAFLRRALEAEHAVDGDKAEHGRRVRARRAAGEEKEAVAVKVSAVGPIQRGSREGLDAAVGVSAALAAATLAATLAVTLAATLAAALAATLAATLAVADRREEGAVGRELHVVVDQPCDEQVVPRMNFGLWDTRLQWAGGASLLLTVMRQSMMLSWTRLAEKMRP